MRNLFLTRRSGQGQVEFEMMSELQDTSGSSMEIDWRGSEETLDEAAGDIDANDPELRRVDILIDVLEPAGEYGGYTEAVQESPASTEWAIKVDVISEVAGAAGTWAEGAIKNRRTGQTVSGRWFTGGGGGGADLPIPSVAPGSWTDFETRTPVTFEALDGEVIRFGSVEAGVGIGYGVATFRFTNYMDDAVVLSGVVFNQWGSGAR